MTKQNSAAHALNGAYRIARGLAARVWYSPMRRPVFALRQRQLRHAAEAYFSATHERAVMLKHLTQSQSTGAGLMDYHFLHAYVLQKQPKKILELGSGATTVVMAQALKELHRAHPDRSPGHLVSMEDIADYHSDVKRLVPSELASYVSLLLSPRKADLWRNEIRGFRYSEVPDEPYDMIFVDGPSDHRFYQTGASLDVFYILADRLANRSVDLIIDSRLLTCRSLQSVLPSGRVKFDPLNRLGTVRSIAGSEFIQGSGSLNQKLSYASSWENLGMSSTNV